ncbi:helix-turn-helix domain-containing protein [Clostridium sp. AL.422]|uniref:helix-turn-helix domain-containing protein n=1 Tax=Clostridium TaxID=1485 RepID=UPI00293DB8D7|nr:MULTISPECIES: helix-turn-helix domain-containing protein [unclassified Clostridium]MDV4152022.1 helix-turn-helix domain-containing protein [Clostridium sp. AL.422]
MSINKSTLKLIKYILDKKKVSVTNASIHFNRNESTIRREIETINLYSKNKEIILIENGMLTTTLNYTEYTKFIQSLSISDYSSTADERINIILISSLLNDCVNLTSLYENLGLSITTKKNDTRLLKKLLYENNLKLIVLKKKGIRIEGDEKRFRLLVIKKLQHIMDVNIYNNLERRKANNPFENYAYTLFIEKISPYNDVINEKLLYFINSINVNISYLSRKFLILYLSVAIFRQENNHPLDSTTKIPINVTNHIIFDNAIENQGFSNIVAILDTNPSQPFPFDEKLLKLSNVFVDNLLSDINGSIIKKDELVKEVYYFMYKQICSHYLDVYFDDKLVNNVEIVLNKIHNITSKNQIIFRDEYNIELNNIQVSTLSLIIKKWLNITDSVKRKSLKIILVTNIVYERVQFFEELIKAYYDVKLVGVFTLDDIDKIRTIEYDFIILFSNRMLSVIKEEFDNAVKVNFFLTDEDIKMLNSLGFKPSKKRILIDDFINEISNLKATTNEEIIEYIRENYNDYFL